MKIRIKGDSVRYRLTKSEVELFADQGIVIEETHFGDRTFSYVLQRTHDEAITAEYNGHAITLCMPDELAYEWTETDKVGFENESKGLRVYIEKDFQCLDNVAEDQSDNYPNPLAIQSSHARN